MLLCQMHDINNTNTGEMSYPKTGATHYHGQLRLMDKGRAIKGLVVCYIVWLVSMM